MPGLTHQLAEFASNLKFADIPSPADGMVGRGLADCIGVMLLGREEEAVTRLRPITDGIHGPATLLFDQGKTSVEMAALVNATAAQALDFDDTGLEGHPSAVLVPVILAVGEEMSVGGQEIVAAYVAGYEIWAELLRRDADKYHARGFHPTGLLGTVAAAAAAASLYRLDTIQTRNALGLAASFASGLVANFGSMVKPLQSGRAAEGGVRAARLAATGYTAAEDSLEHPLGFLHAFSPRGNVDADTPAALGRNWAIVEQGLNLKLYPICYAAHRITDAALALRASAAIDPARIRAVKVSLGRAQSSPLRSHEPRTKMDARFSAEFAVAAALVAGRVTMAELSDAFIMHQDVQTLMRKISLELLDERDPEETLFAPADWLAVEMADGRRLTSEPVRRARGHASNPAPEDVLRAKFDSCTQSALDRPRSSLLFQMAIRPSEIESIGQIYHVFEQTAM